MHACHREQREKREQTLHDEGFGGEIFYFVDKFAARPPHRPLSPDEGSVNEKRLKG
jgi:hypothetical protein